MNSIVDYVEHWGARQPDKSFGTFLNGHGIEVESYTFSSFNERTRRLAEHLAANVGIRHGDRVLLAYHPGLEIIVAFIACARIGAIPVPVNPLRSTNFDTAFANLAYVARDCEARFALTTRDLSESYRSGLVQREIVSAAPKAPLPELNWVATDDIRGCASDSFLNSPHPILFLQYTSGSTSDPKGVIVSHKNVIHNCSVTLDHVPIGVSWLPQYHDMGLIGYYLFPLITGGTTYGFSPMDFLKRPALWLQTLSRVRATYASSPNFGFEYCLREDKVSPEEMVGVDLSSLRVMMNAAEPVSVETYRRFFERFARYGLRPEAHIVAYGLAENTLAVTHYGRRTVSVNKRLLQENSLRIEKASSRNDNQLCLASCGKPLPGIRVKIVDPKTHLLLGDGKIGEIWVTGDSTSDGYWNRPKLTQEIFHNQLANDRQAYLRTGDLGFMYEGDLFVCGRSKDLIILRGVNFYPQDIERVIEATSQQIRIGGVAAFNGNGDRESLVVVAEVKKAKSLPDTNGLVRAIRTQCSIGPITLVLVPGGTITKTTSGKIARNATRGRWLKGELRALATYAVAETETETIHTAGVGGRLRFLLEQYDLTGNEDCTLGEIGIDSLALVMFLKEIEHLLQTHGAAELLTEVDGPFVQRLKVAQLFSLFDGFDKLSENGSALPLMLKQLKQEQDAQRRNRMLNDSRPESLEVSECSSNDRPLTDVLLTGPTGFFGPFLLHSLLRQTPHTYHVLIRAADPVRGMERICDSLRRARIWPEPLEAELNKRVRVVCGDVSKPQLGMSSETWNSLRARVQAVIHNAAMVNYVSDYEALRPHNVDGTRELLRFACAPIRKEFHFISSTVIFGWTVKEELRETDKNAEMSQLDFGYAQSKWVAEQLVFAAEKQGLEVRVYRPAFISASSCGAASAEDIALRLLAFMINHGLGVNAQNQISFLPADVVADNVVAIFNRPQIAGNTFHLTAENYYNMKDITELITREYGYHFVYHDIPSFVEEMQRVCTKADPLYPLLDFFKRSERSITAIQHKRYNNDCYRRAKVQSGGADDPPLAQIVSYLMAYLLREGQIRDIVPRIN